MGLRQGGGKMGRRHADWAAWEKRRERGLVGPDVKKKGKRKISFYEL